MWWAVNVFEAAKEAGIKRLSYASSVAAYGALENGGAMATLYGAFKYCNEQTAKVFRRKQLTQRGHTPRRGVWRGA
jgi:nucleoside-diphosphate-sugar epimerase